MAGSAWGAEYYVDCTDAGSTDQGTFAEPWKTLSSAETGFNSKSAGDDLYFKVGTTCTTASQNAQTWFTNGGTSSGNYTVIGAYEADGDFVLEGGETLPIIESPWSGTGVPSGTGNTVLLYNSAGPRYWRVENLHIEKSTYRALAVESATDIEIIGNTFNTCYDAGLLLAQVTGGIVEQNTITNTSRVYLDDSTWPAALLLYNNVSSVTVKENLVYKTFGEGIGLYVNANSNIVEYNHVYGNLRGNIYVETSANNIIRYNLTYGIADSNYHLEGQSQQMRCIAEDTEWAHGIQYGTNLTHDNEYYGNFAANCLEGIFLSSTHDSAVVTNAKVYNNTFVDNLYNIAVSSPMSGVEIKNNISTCVNLTINSTCYNTNDDDWNWDANDDDAEADVNYNLWHTPHPTEDWVGANDPTNVTNAELNGPLDSGSWTDMEGSGGANTDADASSFDSSVGDQAPWVNTGVALGSPYNQLILSGSTDFNVIPPVVTKATQSTYGADDIGAIVFPTGDTPDPPSGNVYAEGTAKAAWRFNTGGATADTAFDTTYTLTDNGTVGTSTSNKVEGTAAAVFDGSADYYTRVGTTSDFGWDAAAAITVTGWFKIDQIPGTLGFLFSKWDTDELCLQIYLDPSQKFIVEFGHTGGSDSQKITSTNTISLGRWTFWAVTLTKATKAYEYYLYDNVTGVIEEAGGTLTNDWASFDEAGDISIGANADGSYKLTGSIDETTVWATALSDADRTLVRDQIYGATPDTDTPDISSVGIYITDTYYDTATATWSTPGETHLICLEADELISQYSVPEPSELRVVYKTGSTVDIPFADIYDDLYICYTYTVTRGHMTTDFQVDSIIMNDAVIIDTAATPNNLDTSLVGSGTDVGSIQVLCAKNFTDGDGGGSNTSASGGGGVTAPAP